MAGLKNLHPQDIDECLHAAADEAMPVVVSVRDDQKDAWIPCSSRLLAVGRGGLLLELPRPYGSDRPREFVPGEEMCLTFRLNGDKLICRSAVQTCGTERLADGTEVAAIRAAQPPAAHLLQRRAFSRCTVPEAEMLRVGFAVGALEMTSPPAAPVWTGRVLDLGAGGFRAAVDPGAAHELDDGTPVFVCLAFGRAGRTLYAEAVVRHIESREHTAIIGLEFARLTETPEGQEALRFICERVQNYQQARLETMPRPAAGE